MYTGFIFGSLPWWLAAPLLQIGILVFGMALDETYVNRATVLTGAIAVGVHSLIAGETGILVGLYMDAGFIIGIYGIYAYIVDGYVEDWFRTLAFFVYSPLSVFLVIMTAGFIVVGVELLFIPALAIAAFLNLQLMAYLEPDVPYYFGPESEEVFDEVVEEMASRTTSQETPDGSPTRDPQTASPQSNPHHGSGQSTDISIDETDSTTREGTKPEPATASTDTPERSVLPGFMRRV